MVSKNALKPMNRQMGDTLSPLAEARLTYQPELPVLLRDLSRVVVQREPLQPWEDAEAGTARDFPNTWAQQVLRCVEGEVVKKPLPKRVGVVFSGGQAAGGHNVIAGLYDALKARNGASRLFGFLDGSSGLMKEMRYLEIKDSLIDAYRNQGGFDLIGSGRTKIETAEQFEAVKAMMWALELHALVIVGGDDSNTNAALLAEYFLKEKVPCQVIGVPKTIDGDLRNPYVEISFGFDTACKIYSETIGNLARDALSAKKHYYFVKLMGRSASHIALECALQTHANLTLIGEEVSHSQMNLQQVIAHLCDLICERAKNGKDYGVILIPEGLIEFIPDCRLLISELNKLVTRDLDQKNILESLTPAAAACFNALSPVIQSQLLLDRDSFGNVQVSKIETERLLIDLVGRELIRRRQTGSYTGKFVAQPHFCGYEGRSGFPSNFDSNYCYSLGLTAAVLIESGSTGYIAFLRGLRGNAAAWQPGGCPLAAMIHFEERKGKRVPAIKKALVDLEGPHFRMFVEKRRQWAIEDRYRYPGPIQFFGPPEVCDSRVGF